MNSFMIQSTVNTDRAIPTVVVGSSTWKGYDDYHCDGTDDQVEIQQAIDYVSSTYNGGIVYLTPGQFNLSDNLSMRNNVYLMGSGISTSVKGSGKYLILANMVHITNMKIIDTTFKIDRGLDTVVVDKCYLDATSDDSRALWQDVNKTIKRFSLTNSIIGEKLNNYYNFLFRNGEIFVVNNKFRTHFMPYTPNGLFFSENSVMASGDLLITQMGGAGYMYVNNNYFKGDGTGTAVTFACPATISDNIIRNVASGISVAYHSTISDNIINNVSEGIIIAQLNADITINGNQILTSDIGIGINEELGDHPDNILLVVGNKLIASNSDGYAIKNVGNNLTLVGNAIEGEVDCGADAVILGNLGV